jgi:hypothetical protein
MDWACNGETAGTQGYAYQIEALQICLVEKGGNAPGATANPSKIKNETAIMGAAQTSVAQMVNYYNAYAQKNNVAFPTTTYASKGASTIEEFCQIIYDEAVAEGVRPEVLFSQVMHETGWLQFKGDVKPDQCNFGGLGATGNGEPGLTFPDVRKGLRAQVQHLKAYASTDPLVNDCVDRRFAYVKRGVAPNLEDLAGTWASDKNYGQKLLTIVRELLTY